MLDIVSRFFEVLSDLSTWLHPLTAILVLIAFLPTAIRMIIDLRTMNGRTMNLRQRIVLIALGCGIIIALTLAGQSTWNLGQSTYIRPVARPDRSLVLLTQPLPNAQNIPPPIYVDLDQFVSGRILFNPPDRMRVGESRRVEVRISSDMVDNLQKDLRGLGRIEIDNIRVAPFMTVELKSIKSGLDGKAAFGIEALQPADQAIASRKFTQWSYDVTAKESGNQKLYLSVGVRLKLDRGSDEKRFYPLYERNIYVDVSHTSTIGSFVDNNWQWIAGSILIPLVATVYGVWWKRREKKTDRNQTPRIVSPKDEDIGRIKRK